MKVNRILFVVVFMLNSIAWGCFYFPEKSNIKLTAGHEQVFLFHDGDNAHMVIKTMLRGKKIPKNFAWVIPLPSLPSRYEEISGPFFQELNNIIPSRTENSRKGIGFSSGEDLGGTAAEIKVHSSIALGQFSIQPIELMKDGSYAELSSWLKKNRFKEAVHELDKNYLKKGATFLAIRMQLDRPGVEQVTSKSLHLVYRADRLSYPVKFSHQGREVDLDLYIFSKQEVKKDLRQLYFKKMDSVLYENKGMNPFVDEIIGKQKGFLTLFRVEKLNSKEKSVKLLLEDPTFLKSEL